MLTIRPPLEMQPDLGVGREVHEGTANLTVPQRERRRALIVPLEHGAWGMLLVPLVTGGAVGLFSGGSKVGSAPVPSASRQSRSVKSCARLSSHLQRLLQLAGAPCSGKGKTAS